MRNRIDEVGYVRKIVPGLLIFCASVFALPAAHALSFEELDRSWSAPNTDSISSQQLDQLLDLLRGDSETNELLREVLGKIGATSPEQIIKILKLCPDLPGGETGLFSPAPKEEALAMLEPPESASGWSAEIQAKLQKSYASEQSRTEVLRSARWEMSPGICLVPGQSLLESFLVFVHELTHFEGYQALQRLDVLDYRDAEDYAIRRIGADGGEVEAYSAQYRALKRLKGRVGIPLSFALEKYFDSSGNLIDRQGLEREILDKMGYRSMLVTEFESQVRQQLQAESTRLSWFKDKVRPVLEKNVKITASNVELARRSRPSELGKQQKLLVFYTTYLGNLRNAIAAQEKRVRQLKERFPESLLAR